MSAWVIISTQHFPRITKITGEKRKKKTMFLNSFNSLLLNFNLTWVYQSDLIYPKGQSWSILWPSISEHQLLICSGCDTTPRASGVNTKRDPCRFRTSTLKRKLHKALFVTSPLPIFHLSCGLMMREDVEFGVSGWIRVPSIYCLCLFFRNVWMWIPPPAGHWLNFCSSCASFPQISVKQVISVQVKKKKCSWLAVRIPVPTGSSSEVNSPVHGRNRLWLRSGVTSMWSRMWFKTLRGS